MLNTPWSSSDASYWTSQIPKDNITDSIIKTKDNTPDPIFLFKTISMRNRSRWSVIHDNIVGQLYFNLPTFLLTKTEFIYFSVISISTLVLITAGLVCYVIQPTIDMLTA